MQSTHAKSDLNITEARTHTEANTIALFEASSGAKKEQLQLEIKLENLNHSSHPYLFFGILKDLCLRKKRQSN
jgi:hypothetical protein